MTALLRLMRIFRRWHGRIGALAAIFVLFLAVSGVLMNHPDATGLNEREVHSPGLAHWYGIKTETVRATYRAGPHELAWGNGMWLIDRKLVAEDIQPPVGMTQIGEALYVASPDSLLLYAGDLRLIEKIPAGALPAAPIRAIGAKGDRVLLRTAAGVFASADSIRWEPAADAGVQWSSAQAAAPAVQTDLAARLVPGISVQRIVTDIHTGRILGRYGALVVDAVAFLLIVLALSGGWLFLRPRRRHRH